LDNRLADLGRSPNLADGVQLLGFDVPTKEIEVGQPLPVTLYWYTPAVPAVDYESHLYLYCANQKLITRTDLPDQLTPGTTWRPDEIIRADATMWVPSAMEDGLPVESDACTLFLALSDPTSEETKNASLAPIHLTTPERNFEPPKPEYVSGETLGKVATLVGYDLDQTKLKPGDKLALTLHWRADNVSERPLTVFVQLLGQDGRIYAQQDQEPLAGDRPTTGWLEGEFITDTYQLAVDPEAKPGTYQLIVGMYDSQSGERLPSSEPGLDAIPLPVRVEIMPSE
jgi:hypothetical protein